MNKDRLENLYRAAAEASSITMDEFCDDFCGAPGCVFGHYAARGDLQSEFRIDKIKQNSLYWIFGLRGPVYIHSDDISEHFGITRKQAYELFDIDGCGNARTPEEAAAYIRRFIDTDGKP